jgi:hypothetical protein
MAGCGLLMGPEVRIPLLTATPPASTNCIELSPRSMTSPLCSSWRPTTSPLTRVPLPEPWSTTT